MSVNATLVKEFSNAAKAVSTIIYILMVYISIYILTYTSNI